jgi:translation elongation factor EF-G
VTTLTDPTTRVVLESMTFPEPVIEVAIEAETRPTRRSWVSRDPEAR